MVILLICLLTIKSAPSKFKQKVAEKTANFGTKDDEIMVPLKYLR